MDVSTIATYIGSLGFPIVACVCLFYLLWTQNKAHQEEVSDLKDAITALKEAINELIIKLGG